MPIALFIGGPWNGRRHDIGNRKPPPIFDVLIKDPFSTFPSDEPEESVTVKTVRYVLYDNWPVKYLAKDLLKK